MTDFNLRPMSADDAEQYKNWQVSNGSWIDSATAASSAWSVIVDDKVVGHLQASEPDARVLVALDPAYPQQSLSQNIVDRFLQHHLLEAATVQITTADKNGITQTSFSRPA